jgi:hypothetical protein
MKTNWARRGTWAKTDWVAQRKIEIVFAIFSTYLNWNSKLKFKSNIISNSTKFKHFPKIEI